MAAAVADALERRRRPARRGRHRHRKDTRLSGAGDPQPAAACCLHGHQEPPGADLLQGPAGRCAKRSAARSPPPDERPRELPVPASLRESGRQTCRDSTARRVRLRGNERDAQILAADHRRLATRAPTTGDRAELEDLPEDLPLWNDIAASAENCLGTECPHYRRLLRDAHAPARRRIRSRHRQPPPAVRRCRRAPGRLRRGHPRLRRTRSSTKRTSSKTSRRSTSA